MMRYLLLAITINCIFELTTPMLSKDAAFDLYNLINYSTPLLLLACIYGLLPKKNVKYKMLTITFLFYSLISLLDFIFIDHYLQIRVFSVAMFVVAIYPSLISILFKEYDVYTNDFSKNKSYLAYKRPTSLQGYIMAIPNLPYGSVCLVVRGRRFQFKGGIMIEREHTFGKNYVYREIENVPLPCARMLLGKIWKPWHNCFTVFNKYKK